MFQQLEAHFHSEINTLGYPKAALFGFCVALVGYNVLAVVKSTIRAEHGESKIKNELSAYYVALGISTYYGGMIAAIEEKEWDLFYQMPDDDFIAFFQKLAKNVDMNKLKKAPTRKRKSKEKPVNDRYAGHKHVSTARLLEGIMPN